MPSTHLTLAGPSDPIDSAAHALGAVGGSLGALALGLGAGWVCHRTLRSRRTHWSWAALAAVLALLFRRALGPLAEPVLTAALSCWWFARGAHRRDVEAGLDLAEAAARRRNVAQWVVSRARVPRGGLEGAAWRRDGRLRVGRDEAHAPVSVPFGAAGGRHTLVLGATGSGKTVTQSVLAVRAIQSGMGAVVIDPKGDRQMREQLREAARGAGRRFLEWTPRGGCAYNPYAVGSPTEIADKALAGERFTEPHYLRQAQRYLGHVVRAMHGSGGEVSLRAIVDRLDPDRLELLARTLSEDAARPTFEYLDSLTPRQRADLAGVRDRLAIVVESDLGPWLEAGTPGAVTIDLLRCVRERAVVVFDLDADRRPLVSQMIASAIVQDLQTVVSALQREPVPAVVVIDEFAALAAEQVVRLFGRARSAGVSLVLGTQEVSDLRLPGRERLLEQILGNLSVLIAHRQVVPASAEALAALAGTAGAWKVSRHSGGRTTRTRIREAALEPTRITSLAPGWAAVVVLEAPSSFHVARIEAIEPSG